MLNFPTATPNVFHETSKLFKNLELKTHSDDTPHFLIGQAAVPIVVVNFERPLQFVDEFSTKNEVHGCHILHEVQLIVLNRTRRDTLWITES